MKHYLLFLAFVIIGISQSKAQIVTDRPDQTESSLAVPVRSLQIESGIQLSYTTQGTEFNNYTFREFLIPTTLIRYGLFEGIELRLVSEYYSTKVSGINHVDLSGPHDLKISGMQNLQLGTKIELSDQGKTKIAIMHHTILPTGTGSNENSQFGTINKILISHDFANDISVGYNLGYNTIGDFYEEVNFTLAVGLGINEKAAVYFEPYGAYENFDEFILNADAGFTYLLNENLQLDFSFGVGLNNEMNYLASGVSWLIPRK